jgi:hypothetical protein
MPPKNKAPKAPADKVEASKAATFIAARTAARDGATAMEPPAPQAVGDSTTPPLGQEETSEGVV